MRPVVLDGDVGAHSLARAFHEACVVATTVVSGEASGPVRRSSVIDHVVVPGTASTLRRSATSWTLSSRRGAELVVLGCTELSVVALAGGLLDDARVVDHLDVLARATIRSSGHAVRRSPCPERRR